MEGSSASGTSTTDALCSDDAACTVLGISISAVAAFLYASGLCVQRAALMVREAGEAGTFLYGCHRPCCLRHNTTVWVLGLGIYGIGGMFLGTVSLRYIPLSLSSSIFSSVLVFNAFVARAWLKEAVHAVDIVCYLLIMAGISVDAVYLPASPTKIDVHELSRLFREPVGIIFWMVLLTVLMSMQATIWLYLEPQHQVNSSYKHCDQRVYKMAMVCYPVVLGMWEGIAWMMLKTANDLFDRIGAGESYNSTHWLFWFGCSISGPMLFLTITWVRKSYARFPTTQIFPLELGALTIVSVNGGLVFFEEYKGTKTHELLIIYLGIALMISAMVTIAFFKTQSRQPVALEMSPPLGDHADPVQSTPPGEPESVTPAHDPKASKGGKSAQSPRDYSA